jgi:3-oxoadipate enol-lactonase
VPFATADDGTRLHYRVLGDPDGAPLMLLHGLGTDQWGWIRQRGAFTKRFRCIAVDNRGSGRSDKPAGPYDLTVMAADAARVLDHAGVTSAHVLGASMGGVISQILAVHHRDRVRSLVLACTACRMHAWRRELFETWIDTASQRGMRAFATENLNWLIGPRAVRRLYPIAALLGPYALRVPAHALVSQLEAILSTDEDVAAELAGITAPTLVVVGSQDILTPVADAELLAMRIPDAQLAVIRGAAHGFMIEHAATFNATVLRFLEAQLDAGSATVTDLAARRRSA